MRQVGPLLSLGLLLFCGCKSSSTADDGVTPPKGGGDGGSGGASASGSTGSAGSGSGPISTTGAAGSSHSGGGGSSTAACSNSDHSVVPIDSTGWVPRNCDDVGIQGAWYCYGDGMTPNDCKGGTPPWRASSSGMCISGTSLGPVMNTYGAAVGLSLNDSGGTSSVKGPWNATSNNVVGFEVTVTGNLGGLDLRMAFKDASGADVAPFYTIIAPGTYPIMFSQAQVPASWMVANAGAMVMPTALTDLQFQIAGDEKAGAAFDYCITELKPIVADGASTGAAGSGAGGTSGGGAGGAGGGVSCGAQTPFMGGAAKCGNSDVITGVGNYTIQNNANNITMSGESQCITATSGGNCAGFTVSPNFDMSNSNGPGSYPSIVYGWHFGNRYGPYQTPKQISAIASIPSSWSFTVPATNSTGTKFDVSYDLWLNQAGGNPREPDANTLEVMIWLDETADAVPAGSMTATVTIAGTPWKVYTGMVNTWHYIAYERAASPNPVSNLDLKDFITDATTRNVGATSSWYLLSVEAGFEIWKGSMSTPFTTGAYSVTIN